RHRARGTPGGAPQARLRSPAHRRALEASAFHHEGGPGAARPLLVREPLLHAEALSRSDENRLRVALRGTGWSGEGAPGAHRGAAGTRRRVQVRAAARRAAGRGASGEGRRAERDSLRLVGGEGSIPLEAPPEKPAHSPRAPCPARTD